MNKKQKYEKFADSFSKYKLFRLKLFASIVIFVLMLILPITCLVKGQSSIPEITNLKYVNDYVGVIDDESKNIILSLGKELESKTTAQMTVVIINSLEGKDIESYSNELFRTWGIGQKVKIMGF